MNATAPKSIPKHYVACAGCGVFMPPTKKVCACGAPNVAAVGTRPADVVTIEDVKAAREVLRVAEAAGLILSASASPLPVLAAGDKPSPDSAQSPNRSAEVVKHPAGPPAYVLLENFSGQIGPVLARLKKGAVVTDPNLIGQLKALGAPMTIADGAAGVACCPGCKLVFSIAQPSGAVRAR